MEKPIDNVVFPKLKEENYVPIRVSLFGLSDINELPSKVIDAYIDSYGESLENDKEKRIFNKKAEAKAKKIFKGASESL